MTLAREELLRRFYVSYIQDCGHGAAMVCHAVIDAADQVDARTHYVERIYAQGYCCNPAYGRANSLTACFEVPTCLIEKTSEEILGHYYEQSSKDQWFAPLWWEFWRMC